MCQKHKKNLGNFFTLNFLAKQAVFKSIWVGANGSALQLKKVIRVEATCDFCIWPKYVTQERLGLHLFKPFVYWHQMSDFSDRLPSAIVQSAG